MTTNTPTRPSGTASALLDVEEISGVSLPAPLRNDISELLEIEAARATLNLKGDTLRAKLATEKSEAPGRDALLVHAAVKAKKPPQAVVFEDRVAKLEAELTKLQRARDALDLLATGLQNRLNAEVHSDDFMRYLDKVWTKAIRPASPKPSDRWSDIQAYDARAAELVGLIRWFITAQARDLGATSEETSALIKALIARPAVMPTLDRLREDRARPRLQKERAERLAAEAKAQADREYAEEEARLRAEAYRIKAEA